MDIKIIKQDVSIALKEDIGAGDLTAELLSKNTNATAELICRDEAVLCGAPWFAEVFKQLDTGISIAWEFSDGDALSKNSKVCSISGPVQKILTGERTALNFLQTLSGTATRAKKYVDAVAGTNVKILDTRKTIPGLRFAQKYAVRCGGGTNHRIGLYDAILIKENHIHAAGSIKAALERARKIKSKGSLIEIGIEIEVENIDELEQAVNAGATRILIDNFSLADIKSAVTATGGKSDLEASGGVSLQNIRSIAMTGVDYISIGDITKNLSATDYSLIISSITHAQD